MDLKYKRVLIKLSGEAVYVIGEKSLLHIVHDRASFLFINPQIGQTFICFFLQGFNCKKISVFKIILNNNLHPAIEKVNIKKYFVE